MDDVAAPTEVRFATAGDLAGLARCHLRCWRETYTGLLTREFLDRQTVADREDMWREVLRRRPAFIAVAGHQVVGFSGARPAEPGSPRTLELWGIYVHAERHGTGLGQRLLDAAIGTAPAQLWVARRNPRAHAFYRRNGFERDGHRTVLESWEGVEVVRMVRPAP